MKYEKKNITTDILCLLTISIGCCVIWGWYSHSLSLIQLSPSFAPMQFNTALCFVLCGASLILLNHQQSKLIPLTIFPAILMSMIALWAYVFDQKSMVDELFIKAFVSTNQQYPGRMAPNTALSFMIFGISLLLINYCNTRSNCFLKANLAINYFIISISTLALIGYISNLETNYGAGQLIKMAFHTALCFITLSLGLICYLQCQKKLNYEAVLTLLIPFILFNMAFLGWQGIRHNQEKNLHLMLQQAASDISNYIQLSMKERATAFERISYRWIQGVTQEQWRADVRHYIQDQAGYVAIEWIDSDFIIRWIEPQSKTNHVIGYNLYLDTRRRIEIDTSLHNKKLRLSPTLDLIQGGKGIIFFSPLYKGKHFLGLMVGVINTSILFNELMGRLGKTDFIITLKDKEDLIYSNSETPKTEETDYLTPWNYSNTLDMYGQQWQLVIQPSPTLYRQILSPLLPWTTLTIGFLIALLSGFLIASFFSIKKLQMMAGDSNERLNGIIEGSNELIAAIDLNYNLIALNQSYKNEIYRIFHLHLKPGMNVNVLHSLMTEENQKEAQALWKKAFSGKPFTVIQSFFTKDHSSLHFEIRYSPIFNIRGQLIGACHIASNISVRLKNERQITEDHEKLQCLVHNLEEKNTYFQLLKEFTNILHSHTDIEQAKETISIYTKKFFPHTAGVLYLYRTTEQTIQLCAIWNKPVLPIKTFTPSDCLGLTQMHPYYARNTQEDLVCKHLHHRTPPQSYICVPLLAKNKILGLMYFEFCNPKKNTEITFIQLFCEQISLILSNIQLQESLRLDSVHDALTGLYNRRYCEEQIEQAVQKTKRYDEPFSIIMLDIDHFKSINDRYGHLAGDKVLQYLALQMKSLFRESDIIGRWGGEEFILLLKNIALNELLSKAEELRTHIEHLKIDLDNQVIVFTVSIGIACFSNQKNKEQIINDADKALYQAKNEGRNKIVLYKSE